MSGWADTSGGKAPNVLGSGTQHRAACQAEQHEPGKPALLRWEEFTETGDPRGSLASHPGQIYGSEVQ